MSFLSGLGQLAGVAGQAVGGYAQDQESAVKDALVKAQQARQAQNDTIENALKKAQTDDVLAQIKLRSAPVQPKRVYDANRGVTVNEQDSTATPVAGLPPVIEKPQAETWTHLPAMVGGKRVILKTSNLGKYQTLDGQAVDPKIVAPDEPPREGPAPTLVDTPKGKAQIGRDGSVHYVTDAEGNPVTKAAGAGAGTGGAEDIKKAEQLGLALHSLKDVIPTLEARKFSGPNFVTGPLSAEASKPGFLGEVAHGALNMTDTNQVDLNSGMDLFLSAAAHSVGGARITPEQINKFTSGYKGRTGDSPEEVRKKLGRAVDFLNAAAAVLPPDMVAKQHASIDPQSMAILKKYGYGNAPTLDGMSQVQELRGSGASTTPQPAAPTGTPKTATHPLLSKYGLQPPGE